MMLARLGLQLLAVRKQLVNRIPCAASLSIRGVRAEALP
jgi:hypothetical protein